MAVFIETRTDPFVERRQALRESIIERGRNTTPVRRPVRGVEIKEDTYAVIRVALATGEFLPVIDAAGETVVTGDGKAYTTQYTNFLVQQVVEERSEKQQIVETFGDSYIFFFGESPRLVQVQGLLLNTADFNWRAEWWDNYERYFRGTRLVENGARIYLIYDDILIEGYMISAQAQDTAQTPYVIPLSFQLFVTGYTNVSAIGSPDYPQPRGDIDYSLPQSYVDALTQYEQSRNLQREVSIDAVRRANEEAYLGQGRLLTSAIQQGLLGGDPSISGFLQRSQGALGGVQHVGSGSTGVARDSSLFKQSPFDGSPTGTTPTSLFKQSPYEGRGAGRALRGTFTDNQDEFLGTDSPSARALASPLSMSERWLAMDRSMDNAVARSVIDPTDRRFHDLMGRAGRTLQEVNARQGLVARSDGVRFQSGAFRQMSPGTMRTVPFGINAFAEVVS